MKNFKPMLAVKANMKRITYPVLATPKLDGIRCLIVKGEAVSRTLKPIPNDFIRYSLRGLPSFDGELMLHGNHDYNEIQSAVMNRKGEPDFHYKVFDYWDSPLGYESRLNLVTTATSHPRVFPILPIECRDEAFLLSYLARTLEWGMEGVMIRQPDSPYKFGRSTVKEGFLLKIKKFQDDEGPLVRVVEKMNNVNPMTRDATGKAIRSSHRKGKVKAGTAGKVVILWGGMDVSLGFGPGFNDKEKYALWKARHLFKGKIVKFSYQGVSKNGMPRFPKMLGFRHGQDL